MRASLSLPECLHEESPCARALPARTTESFGAPPEQSGDRPGSREVNSPIRQEAVPHAVILVWERMHLVIGCEHYTRLQLQPASGSGAPAAKTGSISLASGFTQPTAASGRQPHGYRASQHTVHTRRFSLPPHSSPALSRLCRPLPGSSFFFRAMTAVPEGVLKSSPPSLKPTFRQRVLH